MADSRAVTGSTADAGMDVPASMDAPADIARYLQESPMLDFSSPTIRTLVEERGWRSLGEFERIRAIYNFVRDEILFGYNVDDSMTGLVYRLAPRDVFHSWVEVLLEGTWYELEAFIIDRAYLERLQAANPGCTGAFCGFGVAVSDLRHPVIDFNRNSTYIQSEGINRDFGVYDTPDELLKHHHQDMSPLKAFVYRNLGRHLMNANVRRVREG